MPSNVAAVGPGESEAVVARCSERLSFETDCWNVWDATTRRFADFVLLDARSPQLYAASHAPGAINLPHGEITERSMGNGPSKRCSSSIAQGRSASAPTRPPWRLVGIGGA